MFQFRAARRISEEIGAQIVLGDRPIEISVCNGYSYIFHYFIHSEDC